MLKVKLLATATAAALFAMGGALAQSSTSAGGSGTSASGASGTSASGATPSGVTSDRKAPTTTTGPRDVGGSDRARNTDFGAIDKNKDGQISRQEWNDYQRGAGAGATSASGGASGSTRADKAPTTTTGPRDTGGSDRRTTGSTAGATTSSGGATSSSGGATSSSGGASGGANADKAPTAPTGPKDTGGTDKPMSTK